MEINAQVLELGVSIMSALIKLIREERYSVEDADHKDELHDHLADFIESGGKTAQAFCKFLETNLANYFAPDLERLSWYKEDVAENDESFSIDALSRARDARAAV